MATINTLIKNILVVIEKVLHLTILAIVVFLCAKELFLMFLDGTVGVSSIMLIFIYLIINIIKRRVF